MRAVSAGLVPASRKTWSAGTPALMRSETTVGDNASSLPTGHAPPGWRRLTSADTSGGSPTEGLARTGPRFARAITLPASAAPTSPSLTTTTRVPVTGAPEANLSDPPG